MAYRTKVEYITSEKTYKPGEILPEKMSENDLSFLKEKGFVELVDIPDALMEALQDDERDDDVTGFDEMLPEEYKSPDEIQKIRKKEDVYKYAHSIGFDLGDEYKEKSLSELQDLVINFQEEQETAE